MQVFTSGEDFVRAFGSAGRHEANDLGEPCFQVRRHSEALFDPRSECNLSGLAAASSPRDDLMTPRCSGGVAGLI